MHIKLINPATDGNKVYDNTGTVDRLVEYLHHEAKEKGEQKDEQTGIFFNHSSENIDRETVTNAINNNVKGLKKTDDKFESLLIAPSEEELKFIGNDDKKLMEYTRKVMENYASNFVLKDGRQLKSEDLVWYASIHSDREVKNIDLKGSDILTEKEAKTIEELRKDSNPANEKKIAKILQKAEARNKKKLDPDVFKVGDKKPGMNKHIHIIISRRDAAQQITLNPRSTKARFNIMNFQERSAKDFNALFGYEKDTLSDKFYQKHSKEDKEYFNKKIDVMVGKMNKLLGSDVIEAERMRAIGEKVNYSKAFFINMGKLKDRYQKGQTVLDPYFFAEKGRDRREKDYEQEMKADRGMGNQAAGDGNSRSGAGRNINKDRSYENEEGTYAYVMRDTANTKGNVTTKPSSITSMLATLAHFNTGPGFLKETIYFDHEKKKIKKHNDKYHDKGQADHYEIE